MDVLCDIKLFMNSVKLPLAATQLLLIFPAALFMAALFVREVQPMECEPPSRL